MQKKCPSSKITVGFITSQMHYLVTVGFITSQMHYLVTVGFITSQTHYLVFLSKTPDCNSAVVIFVKRIQEIGFQRSRRICMVTEVNNRPVTERNLLVSTTIGKSITMLSTPVALAHNFYTPLVLAVDVEIKESRR